MSLRCPSSPFSSGSSNIYGILAIGFGIGLRFHEMCGILKMTIGLTNFGSPNPISLRLKESTFPCHPSIFLSSGSSAGDRKTLPLIRSSFIDSFVNLCPFFRSWNIGSVHNSFITFSLSSECGVVASHSTVLYFV